MDKSHAITEEHALKVRTLMRRMQRLWITGNLQALDHTIQQFMRLPAPAGDDMKVALYAAMLQELCALQVQVSGSQAGAIQALKDADVLDAMQTQAKKDGTDG